MLIKKSSKILMLVVLVLALSGFTFAFAAANVVPDSYAGDGSGKISGYKVGNIHYVLNTSNPSTIDAVTFELDAPAAAVRVKVGPDGKWGHDCKQQSDTSWYCDVSGTEVKSATSLQVVASN